MLYARCARMKEELGNIFGAPLLWKMLRAFYELLQVTVPFAIRRTWRTDVICKIILLCYEFDTYSSFNNLRSSDLTDLRGVAHASSRRYEITGRI